MDGGKNSTSGDHLLTFSPMFYLSHFFTNYCISRPWSTKLYISSMWSYSLPIIVGLMLTFLSVLSSSWPQKNWIFDSIIVFCNQLATTHQPLLFLRTHFPHPSALISYKQKDISQIITHHPFAYVISPLYKRYLQLLLLPSPTVGASCPSLKIGYMRYSIDD